MAYWEIEYDVRKCIGTIDALLDHELPVNVDVEPGDTSVLPGETLPYTITLTNNTPEQQGFVIWAEAIKSNASRVTVTSQTPVDLDAGEQTTIPRSLVIPMSWTAGSYSLKVSIGPVQTDVWETDGFGFQVE